MACTDLKIISLRANINRAALQHKLTFLGANLLQHELVKVLIAAFAILRHFPDKRVLAFLTLDRFFHSLYHRTKSIRVVDLAEKLKVHERKFLNDLVTALQDLLLSVLQLNHVGYEVIREVTVLLTDGLLPVQMHVLFY